MNNQEVFDDVFLRSIPNISSINSAFENSKKVTKESKIKTIKFDYTPKYKQKPTIFKCISKVASQSSSKKQTASQVQKSKTFRKCCRLLNFVNLVQNTSITKKKQISLNNLTR